MTGKKSRQGMPPLPLIPPPEAKEHEGDRLLEILRRIALKSQRQEPQLFYPIREVSKHFHIPLSTVSRIYHQLEEEGILVSVRGSKTLVQGLSSGRHLSVLGFVGIPGFTPSFVTLQDYRTFFIRTRRELRSRGFAVATVFYDHRDDQDGRLAAKLEKYDFDIVLWHQPDRAARKTVPHLKDSGVQVVGVSDRGFPSIPCRYEVQRETAITSILREWRTRRGIKSVVIVRTPQTSAAKEELLKTLLEERRMTYEFKSTAGQRLGNFLESLGREKREGIIVPSLAAAMFAFRVPGRFAELTSRSSVALTGGPVSIPFAQVPDVAADLVIVDWQLVAEQIVKDLISRKAFDRGETTVFEGEAQLRVPLSQYGERL
jgi:hypothetical protein